jgi:molybdopterin/thiamine biosynthesis adenylyltransferase/rhodanese-related sulfurtransferase
MLNEQEKQRYSRHITLDGFGLENQIKLKQAKVLVIGAGGLGCPIIQYLAAAGVGTIGVVDGDTISYSNLQRQILYTPAQVGVLKVNAIKSFISQFNPEVTCHTYPTNITIENAKNIVEKYDVVMDGSDNFATRYLVNDICHLLNKPLVFGSIFKFEGQVTVFHFRNGPSYRCLYPNPPAFGSVPACSEIGVLGVLPGIIGNFMALEVIKVITGIGEVLNGKLLMVNTLSNKHQTITFNKSDVVVTSLMDNYQTFCGMPENKESISVAELHALMQESDVQLVDVREPNELEICTIGGVNIPLNAIPSAESKLDKNKSVYLLCHHGMRSAMAQKWLLENTGVVAINIEGGIHAWSIEIDTAIPVY